MTLLRGHWQLALILTLVFALWQTPVAAPLKILIVFFHEASHAVMTILTGGEVISLSVSVDQGGVVWSRGGSRFWTLTAGYLGSLLIGLALLLAALKTKADRIIMAACGAGLLLIAALYIRDGFALIFSGVTGLAMLACARWLPRNVNDLCLRVIGLASIIYVPFDILSDTILRASVRSDARMLAEEFGGPTVFWGGLWLLISAAAIFFALKVALREPSNLTFKSG